ncbi:MAG: mannosyltransferase family protein [Myxococcales bacterium]
MLLERLPSRLRLPAYLVGAVVLWRAVLFALVFATRLRIPETGGRKAIVAFPDHRFWDAFARWDSGWYWKIATQGYFLERGQSDVAFFPGFPYLARLFAPLTGDVWVAGLIVVNLCLVGSLFFLYGIARHYFDEQEARRVPLWVLMCPASFFFSAFYSEAPFFLAVCAAFYFYERDQLLPAALFGCLAAFTRLSGVLLVPAFGVGILHRHHYRLRELSPRVLFLLIIPLGLVAVALMQQQAVGDALAFIKVQEFWGRKSMFPLWTLVVDLRRWNFDHGVQVTFDYTAVIVMFAVVAASLHRLDLAHSVFALLSVLVPLCSGRVTSIERYSASVIALYLMLTYATRNPQVERFVIYATSVSLALHTVFFSSWYFAG